MTIAAHPFPRPVNSILIAGGRGAPARARRHLLTQLDAGIPASRASDAAVIVSELVTNSVIHAQVGTDRAILLELTALGDYLRIAVIDPGFNSNLGSAQPIPTCPAGSGCVSCITCLRPGEWYARPQARLACGATSPSIASIRRPEDRRRFVRVTSAARNRATEESKHTCRVRLRVIAECVCVAGVWHVPEGCPRSDQCPIGAVDCVLVGCA